MTVVRGTGVRVLMISQYSDYLQVRATLQAAAATGCRTYLQRASDKFATASNGGNETGTDNCGGSVADT